jgi:hypothetical protein
MAAMATLHLPHFDRQEHPRLGTALHVFWASCAAIVMLFIVLAALDVIDPGEAVALTAVVLALAVIWLAHAWWGLWRDERRTR